MGERVKPDMRIHIVFIILLTLLCLARITDMLVASGGVRLATSRQSLFKDPNKPTEDDHRRLADLEGQKNGYVEDAVQAGVELLMLGGICYCFIRVWRKRIPANPAS